MDDVVFFRMGVTARDKDQVLSSCLLKGRGRHYWRYGWRVRDGAFRRWDRQAAVVEETLEKAAPFLDRNTEPGKIARSKLIALNFYAQGSKEPDAAYEWFTRTMQLNRDLWRQQNQSMDTPHDR